MTSTYGVVVGVDRSSGSAHALDWALDEAVSRGVPLTALGVWDASWLDAPEVSLAHDTAEQIFQRIGARELGRVEEAVAEARERLAGRVPAATEHEVRVEQVQGDAVTHLLRYGAEADLLVVGRRGRGTLAHLVMGSVSSSVVHHAQRPVTVVPEPRRGGPPGPAGRHADTATVVVGVDGSDRSVHALRFAAEVAARRGLGLDAVCCWNAPGLAVTDAPGTNPPVRTVEEEAAEALARTVERAGLTHPDLHVRQVVVDAPPSKGLIAYAGLAQMLVVGSRGLGGFDRLVLGSTSSQILRHAVGPVTVVPE